LDPDHSHHVGLDPEKESEIFAENLLKDEILSGMVNEFGQQLVNETKHLAVKPNIKLFNLGS